MMQFRRVTLVEGASPRLPAGVLFPQQPFRSITSSTGHNDDLADRIFTHRLQNAR